MSDIDHLPVRPNINNAYQKSTKPRIPSDLSKSGLLDDSRDPDIQKFVNKKKTDTLEFESTPTKEEKQSKESEKNAPPKEEKGYSWVVIGLAIVIIILIVIVIYYVLKYNEVSHAGDLIPNSVVKPTNSSILGSMFGIVPSVPITPAAPAVVAAVPVKQTEPTKKDLDSVLIRLSTIKEEDEPKISEIVSETESDSESDSELEIEPVVKPVLKSILKPVLKIQIPKTKKKIVEIVEDDKTNSAFLLSENFDEDEPLDSELLEEIIDQANV